MNERNIAISQRENNEPTQFTEFLWWLSTAEKEILVDAVIDRNRYRIIGMTVLATWLFASFTWTYFFYTIVTSFLVAALLGLFMGFIILTIDRALIKGITKFNKKKFTPLLFRGLLALTIGSFMAQPAVLYMFDKEIKLQTSLDNEKRKMVKRQELDTLYSKRKNELEAQKNLLKSELGNKYADVSKARENFLAESDGSGGTGKIGIKDIAIAKRNEYQKVDGEYQALLTANQAKLNATEKELAEIEQKIKTEEANFTNYLNNGFLTRVEALNNLLKNNSALQIRYYLIVFILVLIELMPVIAKTILPSGSYDEKVMLREEMEIEIANSNIKKEQQLKELYNQMAYDNDSEALTAFFSLTKEHRNEKIRAFSQKWKDENHQTFDGLWEKMKKEILTKQEN
jgi:ABC-type multidrug transport system fused ATPase/permease subunit